MEGYGFTIPIINGYSYTQSNDTHGDEYNNVSRNIIAPTTTDTVPNVNYNSALPTQPRLSFIPSQNSQVPSNTSYNNTRVVITATGNDNTNRTTTTIAPLNTDTISNVKYNHAPTPHTLRISSQHGPTPTNVSYINTRVGATTTGI